jgi:hypothetical protein
MNKEKHTVQIKSPLDCQNNIKQCQKPPVSVEQRGGRLVKVMAATLKEPEPEIQVKKI